MHSCQELLSFIYSFAPFYSFYGPETYVNIAVDSFALFAESRNAKV